MHIDQQEEIEEAPVYTEALQIGKMKENHQE